MALLQKSSFIQNHDRVRIGQCLQRVRTHKIAQRIGIPSTAAKDRLLAPRPGITRRLGAHPAGLARF